MLNFQGLYGTNYPQLKRHTRVQKQKTLVASNHKCKINAPHTHAYPYKIIFHETILLATSNPLSFIRYSSFLTSCSRALNCEWVPVFLVHSIKTCVFNHSTRVFNHSTCMFYHSPRVFNHSTCVFYHSTYMFMFVFDHHRFTSICSSSNSSGMHCEYVTNSDSLLRVHKSLSHALLEQ